MSLISWPTSNKIVLLLNKYWKPIQFVDTVWQHTYGDIARNGLNWDKNTLLVTYKFVHQSHWVTTMTEARHTHTHRKGYEINPNRISKIMQNRALCVFQRPYSRRIFTCKNVSWRLTARNVFNSYALLSKVKNLLLLFIFSVPLWGTNMFIRHLNPQWNNNKIIQTLAMLPHVFCVLQ